MLELLDTFNNNVQSLKFLFHSLKRLILFLTLTLHVVTSGAFCYDVLLDNRLDEWKPTEVSTMIILWAVLLSDEEVLQRLLSITKCIYIHIE